MLTSQPVGMSCLTSGQDAFGSVWLRGRSVPARSSRVWTCVIPLHWPCRNSAECKTTRTLLKPRPPSCRRLNGFPDSMCLNRPQFTALVYLFDSFNGVIIISSTEEEGKTLEIHFFWDTSDKQLSRFVFRRSEAGADWHWILLLLPVCVEFPCGNWAPCPGCRLSIPRGDSQILSHSIMVTLTSIKYLFCILFCTYI